MKITGPRVTALWGSFLVILFVLLVVGNGSPFEFALWIYAIVILWGVSLLVLRSARRAPLHRGAFVVPTSASTMLFFAATAGIGALAYAYGIWFAVVMPVPFSFGVYAALRDRALRRRLLDQGAVDPTSPPYLAEAGKPRQLVAWPGRGAGGGGGGRNGTDGADGTAGGDGAGGGGGDGARSGQGEGDCSGTGGEDAGGTAGEDEGKGPRRATG